ncbi:MAG: hypothetical protein PHR35_00715 [Kiritimatiellae bacterium]|nr:hypothetical protein [Kiritimatiellia bacterium]
MHPDAGEITERKPYHGYLIFQGGISVIKGEGSGFACRCLL